MMHPQISFRGPEWFCGIVQPNQDRRVQRKLEDIGHRTFVPKMRKWITVSRRKVEAERPILGRYIFIEIDYPRQSFDFRTVHGLSQILSVMGIPKVMPREDVEDLLHRYLTGEFDEVANAGIPLTARVMVVEGKWAGMLGTVTNISRRRTTVKIDGERTFVDLTQTMLRPAK